MDASSASGELWLRAFLYLVDRQHDISQLNLERWSLRVAAGLQRELEDLAASAATLLNRGGPASLDCAPLMAFACEMENRALEIPSRFLPEVSLKGRRYLAWPTARKLFREFPADAPAATAGMPRSGIQIRAPEHLAFKFIWARINRSLEVSYSRLDEVAWDVPEDKPIKLAVASLVTFDTIRWKAKRHPAGGKRAWVRAMGLRKPAAGVQRLKEVISAAKAEDINVLMFPELTMSDRLCATLQQELLAGSKHSIQLVVAGSWHADSSGRRYVNRSRIFGSAGVELWSQEKTALYETKYAGKQVFEPSQLGKKLIVCDSDTLGRLAVVICSDYCNRTQGGGTHIPVWNYLLGCLPSLVLVPSMQHDGNLERYRTSARHLREAHACSTLVCNLHGTRRYDGTPGDAFYLWLADSREQNDALHAGAATYSIGPQGHLVAMEVYLIDSQ